MIRAADNDRGWRAQEAPIVRAAPLGVDELVRALLQLERTRRVQILDSGGARARDEARYLIAGFDPFETIEAGADGTLRIERRGEEVVRIETGSVLSLLDDRLAAYRIPPGNGHYLPAAGACLASFSYDLVHRFERLRTTTHRASRSEPDAVLSFFDTLIIHDYSCGETKIISLAGAERLDETHEALNQALEVMADDRTPPAAEAARARPVGREQRSTAAIQAHAPAFIPRVSSNFTRDEYTAAVRRIKEHIFAGDIYQANLTQRISCPLRPGTRSEDIFLRLRRDHPASFAAFLRRSGDTVVSASPERFLKAAADASVERYVEAWPIKGTRPRGANREEDESLRAELQASAKDRAENIMIVDLMRNDLGRVSRYGSVEVVELCAVQEHPTLFHLVSKVRAKLRARVTAGQLLRACFPSGSITGAPKIRAMEIIDEIEPTPRGLSMGAIGYFSFDGALDLSVAIRTMVIGEQDNVARFNVGGGIVADSDPALEYEESLVKARALLRALEVRDIERILR